MNLNSAFVQWALKFGLSKMGGVITTIAAQVAAHVVLWGGLATFMPHDAVLKIQGGLEAGIVAIGASLQAWAYGWLVHRQTQGVMVLKQQLNLSGVNTPPLDGSGAVGNKTLAATAIVTGVPIEKAMRAVASAS
jgi:hypothetical protein